ncbi:histidyl-tRNA synthetase [Scopulibacillus darangshiensis]|uniref:Histidine--tRNA ligase n=1 Tax=Scopulibacillus darangshiensis TaxID=442528 RepID=A0A4R2PAZ8_9BACL|nr:histidine--tRNA ligase [Scopulibacillus darangshiensis]TCP32273.1 histidyl-tRNA synthetase [Scopulibacillus darangshiensis]
MSVQIPRGTQDILPKDVAVWHVIEDAAKRICKLYNYDEIRTPMFESTDLFQRGVGDTTDIVQKEMYTFEDRGGRSLTLRPEGTASVVRSFVENKLYGLPDQPAKLYYIGPMFRYERPQAGRTRQFTQFGVEAIGSADPAIDAEVIALAMTFYQDLGLKNLKLVLNSLGDPESREVHRNELIAHFEPSINEFCSDCQNRLEKNPLRILDCKVDSGHPLMETAPSIVDFLNEESRDYFDKVKNLLDNMDISYELDPNLVRGLDYYNHTTFEIMGGGFGAITTLTGGGRYNGLVKELGGPESTGIGFALSIERLLLALEAEKVSLPVNKGVHCFIAAIGDKAKEKTPAILYNLRKAGITADMDYMDRKVKGQFKQADRLNATFVAVLGEEELDKQIINVKNMTSGEQKEVKLEELSAYIGQHI